jgi:perosamine synthetase
MIPVFKPTIKRKHMDSILTCMVSEKIGPGNLSHQFTSKICSYIGLYGGIALSSYYFAIQIALNVLDVKRSDHVIISSLSPQLYSYTLKENGFIPLVGDVDPDSGTLLPGEVEKFLPRNPKAILLHYPFGYIADIEALSRYGLPIIEDISQSFGNKEGDRICGTTGDMTILSLCPPNIITAGAGGLVLTGKKHLYKKLKAIKEGIPEALLLSDMNASLGISQLKEVNHFISRRKEIERVFSAAVMKSRHKTLKQKVDSEPGLYSFPVVLNSGMNEVRKYALKKNIETQPAFLSSVISLSSDDKGDLPHAKSLLLRCLLFPLYPMLGSKNIDIITRVLSTLP